MTLHALSFTGQPSTLTTSYLISCHGKEHRQRKMPLRDPSKEIRVLELQPAANESVPLEAKLIHVPIEETHYKALSYVWGDRTKNRVKIKIQCHQNEILHTFIGESLSSALRHTRRID